MGKEQKQLFNKIKCFCGCLIDKDRLINLNVKIDGKLTKRKVCPEHKIFPGGEQINRLFECCDCHVIVTVGLMEGKRIRCEKCQKAANIAAILSYNAESKKAKPKKKVDRKEQFKNLQRELFEKKVNHPDNPFHCLNFHLCGLCIKPYFECKMFKPHEEKE